MNWNILDTGSIWLKEFASELGTLVPTLNWCPSIRNFGALQNWEKIEQVPDPRLTMLRFPLQRGYARFPITQLTSPAKSIMSHLLRRSKTPEKDTIILTSPYYAPVAELWPGRIIYYLTDLTKKYDGVNVRQVISLDRRMCRVAHVVCPNSRWIGKYLCAEAGCAPEKITVVPNATREQNVLDQPQIRPLPAPADIADLPRPLVGVIGNFAGNMDWTLLTEAVDAAQDVSWVFVGPTDMKMPSRKDGEARTALMQRGGRVRFLGSRSYGQLRDYARAFDAALIPYAKVEPTICGSATRFYEHLASCRPILASRAHDEMLTKEPLLKLVDTGRDVALELERLRGRGFRDGFEEQRWEASREGTWRVRARTVLSAAARADRRTRSETYPAAKALSDCLR